MLSQHLWPLHDTPTSITSFQTQTFLQSIVAGQQQLLEQGEPMHLTGTTNTAATSSSGSASSTSSTTQHNATSTKINRRMPLPPVRYTRPRTVNLNNNGTTTTTGSDPNGVVQFPPRATGTSAQQQQQQHLRHTTGNTNPPTAPAPYAPSNNPVYTHRNIYRKKKLFHCKLVMQKLHLRSVCRATHAS